MKAIWIISMALVIPVSLAQQTQDPLEEIRQLKKKLEHLEKELLRPSGNGQEKSDLEKLQVEIEKLKAENEMLKMENQRLKAELKKACLQNSKLTLYLKALGYEIPEISEEKISSETPPPVETRQDIEGEIVGVVGQKVVVKILTPDTKLQVGDVLSVYDTDPVTGVVKLVGEVKIIDTHIEGMAQKYAKGEIIKGDTASIKQGLKAKGTIKIKTTEQPVKESPPSPQPALRVVGLEKDDFVINAGIKHMLKSGDTVYLKRAGKIIAKLKIKKVMSETASVAEVIEKQEEIKIGDEVEIPSTLPQVIGAVKYVDTRQDKKEIYVENRIGATLEVGQILVVRDPKDRTKIAEIRIIEIPARHYFKCVPEKDFEGALISPGEFVEFKQ